VEQIIGRGPLVEYFLKSGSQREKIKIWDQANCKAVLLSGYLFVSSGNGQVSGYWLD